MCTCAFRGVNNTQPPINPTQHQNYNIIIAVSTPAKYLHSTKNTLNPQKHKLRR